MFLLIRTCKLFQIAPAVLAKNLPSHTTGPCRIDISLVARISRDGNRKYSSEPQAKIISGSHIHGNILGTRACGLELERKAGSSGFPLNPLGPISRVPLSTYLGSFSTWMYFWMSFMNEISLLACLQQFHCIHSSCITWARRAWTVFFHLTMVLCERLAANHSVMASGMT